MANCTNNCKSEYLYLYDLGLNIPRHSTITGVRAVQIHCGCNNGSYDIDTLRLAVNGSVIGAAKRDSVPSATKTDTLGSSRAIGLQFLYQLLLTLIASVCL